MISKVAVIDFQTFNMQRLESIIDLNSDQALINQNKSFANEPVTKTFFTLF